MEMNDFNIDVTYLSKIIIEALKDLSTTCQAITPSILEQELSRRSSFANLFTGGNRRGLLREDLPDSELPCLVPAPQVPSAEWKPSDTEPAPAEGFVKELKDFRLGLLSHLKDGSMDGLADRVSELHETIQRSQEPKELLNINNDILELLKTSFTRATGELEEFTELVREIGRDLLAIESDLVASSSTSRKTHQINKDFNELLEKNMLDIARSVQATKSLSDLKDFLQSKLVTIKGGLERKRKQDEFQSKRSATEIDRLQRRVEGMQQEINRIQSQAKALEEEILLDPLTGIYNRRAYERRFEEEMHRYGRTKEIFSMVIIDIDHFKNINDQFGHLAGDKCLEELSKLIKGALRGGDFLARYGGEEFIAILPGTGEEGLGIVSERLRFLIEKARFLHGSHEIPFTISIGGSCVKESDTQGESLFHRVDGALYEAKRNGRNRVVIL